MTKAQLEAAALAFRSTEKVIADRAAADPDFNKQKELVPVILLIGTLALAAECMAAATPSLGGASS